MKARTIVLAFVLCIAGATTGFAAANANMGSWKLNEAKSTFSPGAPMNTTVVYEAAGDNVKVTVDGIDAGKPTHNEWTGKFDGKDYPLIGSPTSDTRAYTEVDDHTLTFTERKGGKVTASGRIVVSADGKSRTVTATTTNAQGQTLNTTALYDKQ